MVTEDAAAVRMAAPHHLERPERLRRVGKAHARADCAGYLRNAGFTVYDFIPRTLTRIVGVKPA